MVNVTVPGNVVTAVITGIWMVYLVEWTHTGTVYSRLHVTLSHLIRECDCWIKLLFYCQCHHVHIWQYRRALWLYSLCISILARVQKSNLQCVNMQSVEFILHQSWFSIQIQHQYLSLLLSNTQTFRVTLDSVHSDSKWYKCYTRQRKNRWCFMQSVDFILHQNWFHTACAGECLKLQLAGLSALLWVFQYVLIICALGLWWFY